MLEWCEATGTRPTLPFAPQLLVGRGSFYYHFPSSGSRLPTEKALGAWWLLYSAMLTVALLTMAMLAMAHTYYGYTYEGAWLLYGARCAMHPTFSHPLLGPPLHNLLFIHLSVPCGARPNPNPNHNPNPNSNTNPNPSPSPNQVPWGKAGKNFFLKLSSREEMLRWHADLTARAISKSSTTEQRRTMRNDARAPDPEMAPGYELLRKHKQFARQQAPPLSLSFSLYLSRFLALACSTPSWIPATDPARHPPTHPSIRPPTPPHPTHPTNPTDPGVEAHSG